MPDLPPRLRLAADHIDAGRLDQAAAAIRRFLATDSQHPTANAMLGHVLARTGEAARALYHLDLAAARDPSNPDLLANLGNTRLTAGDAAGAVDAYRRALTLDPEHLSAAIGLGNTLNIRAELDEAEAVTLAALERNPDEPRLLQNRAMTLLLSGHAADAVDILERVASLSPSDLGAAGALAFASNYPGTRSADDVFRFHARYGRLMDQMTPPHSRPRRDPSPDRPLRVGILSADLRAHAVGSFIRSWLEHRTVRDLTLTCYSTSTIADEASREIAALADTWRSVPHLPVADLAGLIERDRTDILLDLSGHSTGHRLGVMNLRPAPVQVTYLGYPNTTGLASVDFRIVDSITDPPGAEAFTTERLWRLDPCFLCYRLPEAVPAIAPRTNTALTFGSFNAFAKLSDSTLSLWRRVLEAVPGSRLTLKSDLSVSDAVRRTIQVRFAAAALDATRVHILPRSSTMTEHLSAYGDIDIALDPTPYNGTTTTCESLFMGVPVVSLQGSTHSSRVGATILTAVSHAGLIAASEDDYVRIARDLAADRARLAPLRAGLRHDMLASTLCDGPGFARRFELALRDMWLNVLSVPHS